DVYKRQVVAAIDVDTVYEVPIWFRSEGLDKQIEKKLKLNLPEADLKTWEDVVRKIKMPRQSTNIAIVGKYIGLKDAYKSLVEALIHGGIANDSKVNILWIDSEELEKKGPENMLFEVDGILIPGGFGNRGIEGKIMAAKYAREKKIPYFGICLGMQIAVIEFVRNVCGLSANSEEFDPNAEHKVIYLMEQWYNHRSGKIEERSRSSQMGGTMRLGAYPCILKEGSRAFDAYGVKELSERHRHRYEFNNSYREIINSKGMSITGLSPDGELVEIIEIDDHPWFLGCQFHPEFKSKPIDPHPLFKAFISASIKEKRSLFK
ncbi:MAG: CTP synthase, partial [Thermodesulfovibrionales bacterium]|nr:CTP synthase [Thermodesulfovibrionales bacterium]